jgi:hypothetical protein
MVSLLHEGVVKLVRDCPSFAADLLGQVLHVDVPGFREARLADATLNELVPVEYRADAVVVFTQDKPVFGAILMRRGFTLTAEQRRHIVECIDLAMLEHWLDRALTVGSAEELFR